MCGRAPASKKTCRPEKESAGAYRYLQSRGTSSFQPVDKPAVMVEAPGTEPTGHKKHVIGIEGFSYCIRLNPQPPIIDNMLDG